MGTNKMKNTKNLNYNVEGNKPTDNNGSFLVSDLLII